MASVLRPATVVTGLQSAVNGDPSRVVLGTAEASNDEIKKHSLDASYHNSHPPGAVVFPQSTEEVAAIVKICAAAGVPVVAAAALTGLEGGCIPVRGGVVVDVSRMTKVLEFHEEDMQVTVEAGIMKSEMFKWCEARNLFFCVDPGSNATMGGYASTGASGTVSIKYGTIRENIIRMRVVLPDGRTIWTRSRVIKSSTGYDLNRLFMGSEGTLGIITELTLKVYPNPEKIVAAVASFTSISDAAKSVIAVISSGVNSLARCEILNKEAIECVNKASNTSVPVHPTLFLEFHGGADVVREAEKVGAVCKAGGATDYVLEEEASKRDKLWTARKGAYFAAYKARTGGKIKLHVTDVCLPLSRFAEVITATEEDFKNSKTNLPCPIVGHACDGNFHCMVAYDSLDPAQVAELHHLEDILVKRSLAVGGTASGEHGVGMGKTRFMIPEHGEAFLDVMKAIKDAIDPLGIMNPGKIFPSSTSTDSAATIAA